MKEWDNSGNINGEIVASYNNFGAVSVNIRRITRRDGTVNWCADVSIYPKVLTLTGSDLKMAKAQAKDKLRAILESALKELKEEYETL